MKRFITISLMALSSMGATCVTLPQPTREAKPGVRWWWLGSAVDKDNLS